MKKFWKKTFLYKTINLIKSYKEYRRDKNTIKDFFYSSDFSFLLKQYLNIDIRKDWLGRLYGIINPLINNNGFLDVSNTIIEIDGENTNSNVYVQIWVYKQLELIKQLFQLNQLYDYIDVDIQKVGPINQDNYLLIFDIVSRKEYAQSFKQWIKTTLIYLFIIAIIICSIFLI